MICRQVAGAHGGWSPWLDPRVKVGAGDDVSAGFNEDPLRKKNLPNHGVVSIPIRLTRNLKKRGFMGFPSSESPLKMGSFLSSMLAFGTYGFGKILIPSMKYPKLV